MGLASESNTNLDADLDLDPYVGLDAYAQRHGDRVSYGDNPANRNALAHRYDNAVRDANKYATSIGNTDRYALAYRHASTHEYATSNRYTTAAAQRHAMAYRYPAADGYTLAYGYTITLPNIRASTHLDSLANANDDGRSDTLGSIRKLGWGCWWGGSPPQQHPQLSLLG